MKTYQVGSLFTRLTDEDRTRLLWSNFIRGRITKENLDDIRIYLFGSFFAAFVPQKITVHKPYKTPMGTFQKFYTNYVFALYKRDFTLGYRVKEFMVLKENAILHDISSIVYSAKQEPTPLNFKKVEVYQIETIEAPFLHFGARSRKGSEIRTLSFTIRKEQYGIKKLTKKGVRIWHRTRKPMDIEYRRYANLFVPKKYQN